MKHSIIEFCTYYAQNGLIVVNTTDKCLRMQELDGSIVEIPSSVLPKGEIPESYIKKARKLGFRKLNCIFDASIFINIEVLEKEIKKYVYREWYKSEGAIDIIYKIKEAYPDKQNLVIVGTHLAALAWPEYLVEPVYISDDIIRCDKFIAPNIIYQEF